MTASRHAERFSTLVDVTSADEPDVFERLQRVGDAPKVEVPPVVPRIVESAPVAPTGRLRRAVSPSTPATRADRQRSHTPPDRTAVPQSDPVAAAARTDPAATTTAVDAVGIDIATVDPGEMPSVSPLADLHPLSARRSLVTRRPRPRVRRVTRVVRHVDTWSVFKVALVFSLVLVIVMLTAGVLLWNVAHATGTIDNIESFFEQFGWSTFEFQGREIFDNAVVAGLFAAIGLTGFAVLTAAVFNLVSDIVGGVRLTVLEEEVVVRAPGSGPLG